MKKRRQTEKKSSKKIHHKMRVLKIFTIVLVLIVVAAGVYSYVAMKMEAAKLNNALLAMKEGDLDGGLEKCGIVSIQEDRGFCYSFYLGLNIKMIMDDFSSKYGDNLTDENKDLMKREIRNEYSIVCSHDTENPYMVRLCSNIII